MGDQKCIFTVKIMGEDYILLRLLFDVSTSRAPIEDIGLANLLLVPYFMRYINMPVYEYPASMWPHIVDIHILIKWLGYRNIDSWNREALRYSMELEAYLDGADMAVEQNRLETFKNWPHEFINVNKLAKTGFYFSGPDCDVVKCNFCNIRICNWVEGDDEVQEHLRWSSSCPLLRRANTNNRPISVKELDNLLPAAAAISYDVCGYHEKNSSPADSKYLQTKKKNIDAYQFEEKLRMDALNTQLICLLNEYKAYVEVSRKYRKEVRDMMVYLEKQKK